MKTSLQNTLEDIKSKEDKDSDIPAYSRTRGKLHLDDLRGSNSTMKQTN